jgi:hypothetical protein
MKTFAADKLVKFFFAKTHDISKSNGLVLGREIKVDRAEGFRKTRNYFKSLTQVSVFTWKYINGLL